MMKRQFEPYKSMNSRFCSSYSRIHELPDDESSEAEQFPSSTGKHMQLAQVTHRNLPLLDWKLAKHSESATATAPKPTACKFDAEDPGIAANPVRVVFRKMTPELTDEPPVLMFPAEAPIAATAPPSHQLLITMFATLSKVEQQLFTASNPMASIIKGKTRVAEEKLRMEKESSAFLLSKVSELQIHLGQVKQASHNKSRGFEMLTKIELRDLMASHEPAKEIIDELVTRGISEKVLERSRGLSNSDMYELYCEHPDVGEQFEKHLKEALVGYKLLCRDSYMQALREVEKDCKVWLEFQKEELLKTVGARGIVEVDKLIVNIGPSPAARAIQKPMMWATPDIPRDPAKAIEKVRDAAGKTRASLEGVKKRKQELDMDKESVHKRVMRDMGDRYS